MNDSIRNKLNDILDVSAGSTIGYKEKDLLLKNIEMKGEFNLPSVYKDFLFDYGAGFINDSYMYKPIEKSPMTDNNGLDTVDVIYGLTSDQYDLYDNYLRYVDMVGYHMLPIGEVVMGDLVFMSIAPETYGKVYYWYHENKYENEDGSQIFYLIADSFEDFVMSFIYAENTELAGSTGVKKITLDPKLMKLLPKQE